MFFLRYRRYVPHAGSGPTGDPWLSVGVTQSNRAPRITHTPNLGTYTSDRNFNPFWGPTKRTESTFSLVLFIFFVSSVHFFMIFFFWFLFLCDMSLFAPSFPFSPSRRWRGNNLTYNHTMQCTMPAPSSNHIMQCTMFGYFNFTREVWNTTEEGFHM